MGGPGSVNNKPVAQSQAAQVKKPGNNKLKAAKVDKSQGILVTIASIALIAIGIALCATGLGAGLGAGAIVLGGGALAKGSSIVHKANKQLEILDPTRRETSGSTASDPYNLFDQYSCHARGC